MTIATYRGVKYDTQVPKQDYLAWLDMVRAQVGGALIYRGHDYKSTHGIKTNE